MKSSIIYRPMKHEEETEICDFVCEVFNEFEAPEYSQEGIEEFLKYVQPDLLLQRSQANHFVLVASIEEKIVGMIEIRNHAHISLMFVKKTYHRRGIAKELFRRALDICLNNNPELSSMTVNSSPYAVPIYERFGFIAQSKEIVKNGIRFIPMTKHVSNLTLRKDK